MKNIKGFCLVVVLILCSVFVYGQESKVNRSSIKSGTGVGGGDVGNESGRGPMLFLGYQRSYMEDRIRINPNIFYGVFNPSAQDLSSFHVTALGINGYIDILKSRSTSLFLGTGLFANYIIMKNDGAPWFSSYYPNKRNVLSYAGLASLGVRLGSSSHRMNLELSPINFQMGTGDFLHFYMKLGLEIKLGKLERI